MRFYDWLSYNVLLQWTVELVALVEKGHLFFSETIFVHIPQWKITIVEPWCLGFRMPQHRAQLGVNPSLAERLAQTCLKETMLELWNVGGVGWWLQGPSREQGCFICCINIQVKRKYFRSGLTCQISNGATVEEHLQFWILVAGRELEWKDDNEVFGNKVTLPGDGSQDTIGLNDNTVGTIIGGQLVAAVQSKRTKSAVCRGIQFHNLLFSSFAYNEGFKVLVQNYPSPLKSICRRQIRKNVLSKKCQLETFLCQKLMNKPDLKKYLMYKA